MDKLNSSMKLRSNETQVKVVYSKNTNKYIILNITQYNTSQETAKQGVVPKLLKRLPNKGRA